ncbi:MAG: hypothetical protein ICV72_15105 [Aldersonia sp.]|nr:hypothetical protein [Aldersonia sp.]
MSHEEIYDSVFPMNSQSLNNSASEWTALQNQLSAHVTWGIAAAMKEIAGWEGEAADAANQALNALSKSGFETEQVMTSVSSRLHQAGFAVDAIKAAVPPPEQPAGLPLTILDIIDPKTPLETKAAAERAEELRQQAIRAMNDIYVPTLKPVGDAVPAFVAPNDPTSGGPGVDGGGGGYGSTVPGWLSGTGGGASTGGGAGSGAMGNASPHQDPLTSQSAATGSPDAAAGGAAASGSGADGAASTLASARGVDPTSASPNATTPASYTPTGAAADGSSNTSNAVGGGHSAGGGSGAGAGGGAFGGPLGNTRARREEEKRNGVDGVTGLGVGALGGAMAGALASGGETIRPGTGVAAAAKSAPPMGLLPGARGSSGDEDKKHETPSYLITAEHGSELIGDIAPTAPPVLGAWDRE